MNTGACPSGTPPLVNGANELSPPFGRVSDSASIRDVRVISDPEVGFHGGYRLVLEGHEIGTVKRVFPTWERRTKGRRYVNARGTCKRCEYEALEPGEWYRGAKSRTLREAVHHLFAQVGRNPEGEDLQGLRAEHEHAVTEGHAPRP